MMLDIAEFATGVSAKTLKIIEGSVQGSLDSVHHQVQDHKGQIYRCFFSSVIAVTSDALCTPVDETGKAFKAQKKKDAKEGRCNALLKAAGRC